MPITTLVPGLLRCHERGATVGNTSDNLFVDDKETAFVLKECLSIHTEFVRDTTPNFDIRTRTQGYA